MSSELNLSEEEVAALRQGIEDGTIGSNAGVMPDGEVAPFAFGSGDARDLADMHALHLLNERLARGLRQAFQPILRLQPKVNAETLTVEHFETYADRFDDFLSLNVVRLEPLRGTGLITLKPDLIGALVDAYYGGRGEPPVHRLPEFTPAEDRIIQTLLERMFVLLNTVWEDVFGLQFSLVSSESHPQFLSFLEDEDMVIVTRFMVELPRGTVSPVEILYPLQPLKPLLPLLRSRVIAEQGQEDAGWQQRLRSALLDVELPVRSILAEPTLPLRNLMALKSGDVIPIVVAEELQMLVDRTPFGVGIPGEANGNAALRLRSIAAPHAATNR